MKVSIIITVYNEEKYINKCVSSLMVQEFKDFEVIVVDDGSMDKTYQVLSELRTKNYELRIFRRKHQGPAIARNLGAKYARGEILVFVDGDMLFDKEFLQDLVCPIKLGKAKGTYSLEEYVVNWENTWARCWNYNWNLPNKRKINPKRGDQAKDFRAILKSEFDKVNGFDNTGYTDTWSLSEKLNYKPKATQAKYSHYNPASLKEVFFQARWTAKRKFKFGKLGKVYTFFKVNPLFSLLIGLYKGISKKEPVYPIFKLVYDFGFLIGLITKNTYA